MPEVSLGGTGNLLSRADAVRKVANGKLDERNKTAFGQYMTPAPVASFMASLFPTPSKSNIRLLDPGAGVGSLTTAFFEKLFKSQTDYQIEVDAFEIDPVMRSYLEQNLIRCSLTMGKKGGSVSWRILDEDFIIESSKKVASVNSLFPEKIVKYTHCIMNPPYKKISSSSKHRTYLRTVGIETVNQYSAFVALALLLLEKNGYLVAIIPRSFCNGPYYRPFREYITKYAALKKIHLFGSRNMAFREDKVLQENIIIVLEKGGEQKEVTISTSTDDTFSDISISDFSFSDIIREEDKELFIHIPTTEDHSVLSDFSSFCYTLSEIEIQVSTGPVVDFRLKDQLRKIPEDGTVPLLYPRHFKGNQVHWPIECDKRANAIVVNENTQKWLYPNGFYTVVRRFSSKEEKRRIVASVVDPTIFNDAKKLGLENHLNVFHWNKKPLSENIAWGLAVFLNSTAIDNIFRRFSGHTQVNATDLRLMKYPSRKTLIDLGKWAVRKKVLSQDIIDKKIESISE